MGEGCEEWGRVCGRVVCEECEREWCVRGCVGEWYVRGSAWESGV